MNFTIDPEIKTLLPELTSDEFDQLSLLVRTDGCLEPLALISTEPN